MTPHLSKLARTLTAALATSLLALPAWAVEVSFKPVADGVYAYVGDIEGRSYELDSAKFS